MRNSGNVKLTAIDIDFMNYGISYNCAVFFVDKSITISICKLDRQD